MKSINRKGLYFVLAAFMALSVEVGCMNRSELDEEKKKLFSDIEEFNRVYGMRGWGLKNVQFTDETIRGIKLFNSTWENVGLENVDLSGCELRNTVIRNAECYNTNFSGAVMENVKFESCNFEQTKFEGSEFLKCEFIECHANEAVMEKASFRECKFKHYMDEAGIYEKGEFYSTHFEDSHFNNSSFFSAILNNSKFDRGKIENTTFSGGTIEAVEMIDLDIDYCSFNEIKSVALTFAECRSKGVSFGNSELEKLEFKKCSEFNVLSLSEVECSGFTISDCKSVSEPMFYLSKIENLTIDDSNVEFLDGSESEYSGIIKITNSKLHGLNLMKSKITGMNMTNCRIENFLYISESKFENLNLEDIDYANDLKVNADSVTYINSDKFPES